MNLRNAEEGIEYKIIKVDTDDEELNSFLFSLGCYSGQRVTVVAHRRAGMTVALKDGRYHIDLPLAEAISIEL